jgi:hypothetical protein
MRPLALEQRFMFDGAVVDAAADAVHAAADGANSSDAAADTGSALRHALMAEAPAATGQRQEVVFVDGQVANLAELLQGLSAEAEVVILDPSKDGLQQMADYLQGRSGLDAIHLLSHGADGKVQVGSLWLSSANLAEHNAALQSIGAALDANGDLLFYGCSVGASSEGQAFLDAVANITGADVAASVDATGAAALGGNWILEKNTGTIESKIPFNSDALDNYNGLLYLSDGTYTFSGTIGPNNSARSGFAIYSGNDGNFVISNGFTIDPGTHQLWSVGAQGAYDEANLIISVIGAQGTPFTFKDLQISLYPGQPSSTFIKLSLVTKDINGSTIGNYSISSNYSLASSQGIVSLSRILNANNTFSDVNVASVELSWQFAGDAPSNLNIESITLVDMQHINEAPQVNLTATNPTYTENGSAVQLFSGATVSTGEAGQLVQQMRFTVSGIANGSEEKLVIDGADVTLISGTSLMTLNNGLSVSVSVSSGTATVTLDKAAGLSTATAQTILNTMAYRNDSESPSTANRVVTLTTVKDSGGTANGGVDTKTVAVSSTVKVVGVNDAPVLAGGPYSLPSITEDTTASGTRISTLLTNYTMVDPDVGALHGIAVITKTGNGTWQYSTDNANWTDFGAVSSTSALLLSSTTYIRYVPDGANGETASLTFRGWDQTTGSASVNGIRGTADTSSNGGTTAFSIVTAVANQPVTSVNDAPVMTGVLPSLSGINDDAINNGGALVSDLLGGVTDVDAGALKGMAITDLTATYGKWQYSLDAGSTWSDVGVVSTTSALILTSQNMVRFVPDAIHGETASITYKAWDQTANAGQQGSKVDATTAGGTSAFSTNADTASVLVTAVNDAPVVTVSSGSASWTEGNNVVSTPVAVDPGLTLVDADGPNPTSATARMLTYYSAQDTLSFVNDGLTMGNIIGTWTVGTGTLTLTSAGNQATAAQFEAALRAITYNNSSDNPNTTTRTVQFIVTDGSNAQSTAVARDITITAVNDSPTISAVASLPITEDTQTALGQITFSDVDTTLGIATFSVGSGTLSAIGAGGVTVGGTATALTLSGTLANINNFIAANRLLYTPAANASGDVTLTININTTSVSDATTTVTLQVTAVNDAPVVSVPVSIGVTEDVASVISGISFTDVDAGANTVTATFSVPSGTLSASSTLGVTVGGSGTDVLTLSGSLADINAFISANSLTFKTAQDATTNVVLTVTFNDKGFSGSGGEQTDTKTVTLIVTAVNDAPVNNVPGAQTAQQNIALGFNTANGNAISITDVDAGNGLMTVTLTASNGTLSLGSLSGITVLLGTGTNDASMTFEGNRANINAALQTLSFKSGSTFLGAASLTIETNDNGNSGSGGAKTDVDTISINVIPVNPKVVNVAAQGLDRTVKIGDEVLISMTWDQVVNVDSSGGTPSLLLETGLVDRNAVYVSGSGSNTLVFKYIVQAGDVSADLDFQSTAALQLHGAVLSNATNDLAVLTLPTVGGADSLGGRSNIVVDGVAPVVTSVGAPADGTYIPGQNLDFTVNLSENVVVDTTGGTPRLEITLDTGGTVYADYVSGSGGSALVFRMTVASGQLDSNGISLGSALQLNGGSIRDSAGNDTVVTLQGVGSTANVNIDGVAPEVASVTTPADGHYKAGDVLSFTVNASESVQTGTLPPRLVLDVGGVTRYATYVSGSGSAALVFQYTVQAGDNDADGIAVNSIDLRGEQLTDLAGNDMNLALNAVGATAGIVVDTTAPTASLSLDKSLLNAQGTALLTVRFSEAVTGLTTADFTVANGTLSNLSSVDGGITWTATFTPNAGVTGSTNFITLDNTAVQDGAGNTGMGTTSSNSYAIDTVLPAQPVLQVESNVEAKATVRVDALVAGGHWEYSLDGGQTWAAGQGHSVVLQGAGVYALQVRQSSAAGNMSTASMLSIEVFPVVVPPTVAWPSFESAWGGSLPGAFGASTGASAWGLGGEPPAESAGSQAFFAMGNSDGRVWGTSGLSSFFRGGVASENQELSHGFLGAGRSDAGVFGASTLSGLFSLAMPESGKADPGLVVRNAVDALEAGAGQQVDWLVPPTLFGHSDPLASVQLSMTQADGRALPAWLKFDARTGKLTGTMPEGFKGELVLRLTARDSQGHAVHTSIKLKAAEASPVARMGVAEQLQHAAQQRAGQMTAQRLHI